MRKLALLALLLAGCSAGPSDDSPAPLAPTASSAVSLRNEADVPIAYFAAGEGTLALIATPRTLVPREYEDRLVVPGQTAPVPDILGYMEELGVNFFVWVVDPATGVGLFHGIVHVTAAELARSGGLVTFSRDRFTQPR